MITFDPLWPLLKERGESNYTLRTVHHLSSSSLAKLRHHGEQVSTVTINHLCRILNCQPGEIMQYIPQEGEESK